MSKVISLSEASSIGLHGMVLIAQSDGLINVNHIAEITSSSRHHVAKVFQLLVKAGLLTSTRGPNGGFVLKKSPEKITLLEIYELIEGKIDIDKCPVKKETCPFKMCLLEDVAVKVTDEFKKYLKNKKLSDFNK